MAKFPATPKLHSFPFVRPTTKKVRYIERMLEIFPNLPELLFEKGIVLATEKNPPGEHALAESLKYFNDAIDMSLLDVPNYLIARGWVKSLLKKTAEAEADFLRARNREPDNPDVWISIAQVYLHCDGTDKASDWLREAVEKFPANANVHANYGFSLITSHPEEALREYAEAKEYDDKNPLRWLELGRMQLGVSLFAEAVESFDTVIELAAEASKEYKEASKMKSALDKDSKSPSRSEENRHLDRRSGPRRKRPTKNQGRGAGR